MASSNRSKTSLMGECNMHIELPKITLKEFMKEMIDKERKEFTRYYINNVWGR